MAGDRGEPREYDIQKEIGDASSNGYLPVIMKRCWGSDCFILFFLISHFHNFKSRFKSKEQ